MKLFTNCLGSFVIDKGIKDKILFDEQQASRALKALREGRRPSTEAALSKKYPSAELIKGIPPPNILQLFSAPEFYERFHKNNMLFLRETLSESLTDDQLIIQTIKTIEDIDKISNSLTKRVREWYSLYNPETSHAIEDNARFIEEISTRSRRELLGKIGMKENDTMGSDLEKEDLDEIMRLAKHADNTFKLRKREQEYLEILMKRACPNITALSGSMIGARLIEIAGGLEQLSKMPASTIQLLGAEKALFRHLKSGAKPPKFGVLINHPLVSNVQKKEKGKIARMLGDKISIASKVDYFKGEFIGDKLKSELEERFR